MPNGARRGSAAGTFNGGTAAQASALTYTGSTFADMTSGGFLSFGNSASGNILAPATAVPEPSTSTLLAAGSVGLASAVARRRRAAA